LAGHFVRRNRELAVFAAQSSQFDELPDQRDGAAKDDVSPPAQKAHGERDLGRHTEGSAQQDMAVLLDACISRDKNGKCQPDVQQSFDSQRVEKADLCSQQPECDRAAHPLTRAPPRDACHAW
jgi:hypothetical protein